MRREFLFNLDCEIVFTTPVVDDFFLYKTLFHKVFPIP